jgi:hypothetical protein
MKETLNGLSMAGLKGSVYEAPQVTVVTICPEGLLCQSGGVLVLNMVVLSVMTATLKTFGKFNL